MDITYQYQKPRFGFGRQELFCEAGPHLCDSIVTNPVEQKKYILRNPIHASVQHTPDFSENIINTIRVESTCSGANHAEGGWPRDVNIADPEATQRYRRKIEKDDPYINCVHNTAGNMEKLILQNNAIDMYQTFFNNLGPLPQVETTSCRTINEYRDVGALDGGRRPVSSICWKPGGALKFAATYVNVDFDKNPRQPVACFIWDAENSLSPESTIFPPSALLDLQYNEREPQLLAGGLINGQVVVYDLRSSGLAPGVVCPPHVAHRELVRNVRFINAKSGMELFSGGADGACKWWDCRNMSEPIDTMIIDVVPNANVPQSLATAYGISCLEFEPTIPTRFMVGTDNGFVISGNRKGKSPMDQLPAKFHAHNSPVFKIERNPGFLKNFLSVGDFTARVWSEDTKDSALLWTPPLRYKVTHGAWSPTRFSLMMLTQSSGVLSLWDLLRRQYEPVLKVQVCEPPLVYVQPHEAGTIVACGNSAGTIYLLELSRNLAESDKLDKQLMTLMLERENKRERILEARLREMRLKLRQAEEGSPVGSLSAADAAQVGDKDLLEATTEYFAIVKKELSDM